MFLVEVTWATDKDTLKTGQVASGRSFVSVEANTDAEAMLIAQQIVGCRHEPTGADLIL